MSIDWSGMREYESEVRAYFPCCPICGSKEIFLYAVNKLGFGPNKVIFVGDSVKRDYEGAKKTGLKPLFINRTGEAFDGVNAITSLTEVLTYF